MKTYFKNLFTIHLFTFLMFKIYLFLFIWWKLVDSKIYLRKKAII